MSIHAFFEPARKAHADARWRWHLARERGQFLAMLDAEIEATAALEQMKVALAQMGFDHDFREEAVWGFASEAEEWASTAPFWSRIARVRRRRRDATRRQQAGGTKVFRVLDL